MEQLTFIGSGSAFVSKEKNWQSNAVLESGNNRLLIDCGSDVRHALADAGIKPQSIDAIFITHFHADHIGGLEWFGFMNYFPRQFKPDSWYPKLFVRDNEFAKRLWQAIEPGLASIEFNSVALASYFDVRFSGELFYWQGKRFEVIQTIHTLNGNSLNPSYGLFFPLNHKNTFFSGDTQFNPNQYIKILREADLVFHDCETSPFESGVHSHWKRLLELPPEIKAKMWLYHFDDKPFDAKAEGFKGWVEKGQSFTGEE